MSRSKFSPNYTSAIVLVHGESEEQIVKHIKSSLRLNIHIHKRKTSIQINGLLHELDTNFKDVNALKQNKRLIIPIKKNRIITEDFKIFTLMDTDDCSEDVRAQYIDKSLFNEYLLAKYVMPVYNIPNLENVLYSGKIIPKIFKEGEKMKNYAKIFPVSCKPLSGSKIDDMKRLVEILEPITDTNMDVFINYCIDQAQKRKIL